MLRSPGPRPTTASRPRGRPARARIGVGARAMAQVARLLLVLGTINSAVGAGGRECGGFGDAWRSGFCAHDFGRIGDAVRLRRKFLCREEPYTFAIGKCGDRWLVFLEIDRGKAGDGDWATGRLSARSARRDRSTSSGVGAALAADADGECRWVEDEMSGRACNRRSVMVMRKDASFIRRQANQAMARSPSILTFSPARSATAKFLVVLGVRQDVAVRRIVERDCRTAPRSRRRRRGRRRSLRQFAMASRDRAMIEAEQAGSTKRPSLVTDTTGGSVNLLVEQRCQRANEDGRRQDRDDRTLVAECRLQVRCISAPSA